MQKCLWPKSIFAEKLEELGSMRCPPLPQEKFSNARRQNVLGLASLLNSRVHGYFMPKIFPKVKEPFSTLSSGDMLPQTHWIYLVLVTHRNSARSCFPYIICFAFAVQFIPLTGCVGGWVGGHEGQCSRDNIQV